jgi:hypothetical protein
VLRDLGRLDLAVYRAIASTPTPTLDEPRRRLSDVATRSQLWLGIAGGMAGGMALVGGKTGRPRTIEYHLRKVFTKLGIFSRAELVRMRLDGEPVPRPGHRVDGQASQANLPYADRWSPGRSTDASPPAGS